MGKYIDPERLNDELVIDIRKMMEEIDAVLDNISDEEMKSKSALDISIIHDSVSRLHEDVMDHLKTW